MPELPEVETVKNGIAQFAGKAEIVDVTVRNRRLRSVVPDGFETAVRGAKIKARANTSSLISTTAAASFGTWA